MNKKQNKNIEAVYPLSPMQQGMLFHSLYKPDSGEYCEQLSCTIRGEFEPKIFEMAWNCVIERHPILRTSFVWKKVGRMLQVVQARLTVASALNDWREKSPAEQQEEFEKFILEDRSRGFQISSAPLFRLSLFRTADAEYKFLWTFHHILLDGWSMQLLLKELFVFYEALLGNQTVQLHRVRPYRDYINWLQQQDYAAAGAFWKQHLKGFPAPTPLTTDRLNHEKSSKDYHKQIFRLEEKESRALQNLAKQQQITMSSIVNAAWALLLSRYSGEDDVVHGATFAGRPASLQNSENMVGLFINTLPVRVSPKTGMSVTQFLNEIHQQFAALREFEYTPLVEIQGHSEVPRDMPLFNSIVVFENFPLSDSLDQQNLRFEVCDVRTFERTNYPLTVVSGPGDRMPLEIAYDTSRFTDKFVERMIGNLGMILKNIALNTGISLESVPLLSDSEKEKISTWNSFTRDFPSGVCIHELFEAQVKRNPESVAISFEQQSVTYGTLNRQANRLARYLRDTGVKTESLVGICLERTPEMILSVLAVLKAGGAYVPVDPEYPVDRIAYMFEDAGISLLITESKIAGKLPETTARKVLIDSVGDPAYHHSDANLPVFTVPENLAYVIYTSGSTGRPKGTLLQHRGFCNFISFMRKDLQIAPSDTVLQFASFSFDASVAEIFLGLLSGARLQLCTREEMRSIDLLDQLLLNTAITAATLPPAVLSLLPAGEKKGENRYPRLRSLASVGESCSWEVASRWMSTCRFLNGYGPTEATVGTSWAIINRRVDTSTVPIGSPIANAAAYIVDKHLNLQPINVPGELYIGGAGVARGYLNRPDLTAEKFIPDPFGKQAGARMYRSGDQVRLLPEMKMEFVGRMDHQVKIRGLRIELGEIESVSRSHPAVHDAVVVVRVTKTGGKQVIAYIIPEKGPDLTPEEIRLFLGEHLPSFMVPSSFVFLEQFPLTPNGKIDRRALPEPEYEDRKMSYEAFSSPDSPTEEIVARIWEDLLHVEQVNSRSNFFELGGHSLLATQLISRIRDAFGIELPLRELFESANLKTLAEVIDENRNQREKPDILQLKKTKRPQNIPLSFAQQRLWFIHQFNPESPLYNIPSVLFLKGMPDLAALKEALNELVRRHEILRTVFQGEGDSVVQVIRQPYKVDLPVVNLEITHETVREKQVVAFLEDAVKKPFDLENGPLFRCLLLHLENDENILLFEMHHIITDGWSINIIMNEISALYDAFHRQKTASLPELPVQYADYAIWQRDKLNGERLEQEVKYWKQKLEGIPPLLQLPTDRPRPAVQTFNGASRQIEISGELFSSLMQFSRKMGVTPYIILLAVYKILLARYSGQNDIVVGMPVANRRSTETEKLIGFFVNTLVIRSRLTGELTFADFIRLLRNEFLDCYAHQDLPFEKLVEEIQPDRNMSYSPIFQAAFALQDVKLDQLDFADMQVQPLALENHISKYDLTAYLSQSPDRFLLVLEYNTDLFEKETIRRMLAHFRNLLENGMDTPEHKISRLNLHTNEELNKILVEWNQSQTVLPAKPNLPALFESVVSGQPDAPAVVFVPEVPGGPNRETLTYDYLNRRANQLARYLLREGVIPDSPVGILLDRSPEMIIAILGILKAGAAFIPLDPTYPADRISYMLQDAGLKMVLTSEKYRHLSSAGKTRAIEMENVWSDIHAESQQTPAVEIDEQNLAYMIYTSGSTGKPKGSMLTHRGVINLAAFQRKIFEIAPEKRILQFASLSFDASVWEIVMALLNGAALFLTGKENISSAAAFTGLLSEERITTLTLPPSFLNALSDEPDAGKKYPHLQHLITAGEAVSADLVNKWAPGRNFFNAYGPTETTVCASIFRCGASVENKPPIGRPIDNFDLYILDRNGQPVPVGATGELYIGGTGLARGYYGRSEQTAEKFVPHPFSADPGARLYRSGDLARYRPDGNIDFLGRIDNQVKVRGFRIELGEIETTLKNHPQVSHTVVICENGTAADTRLVGYVVPVNGKLDSGDLRSFLRQKLPDYMIPGLFIHLNEMPLTPSGKIDRKALPKPVLDRTEIQAEFVGPRNATEEQLVQIVTDLLHIEKPGVMDSFFDLGGHSLAATQFMSRIKTTFQVNLPLRQIFETPTIADIASIIEQQKSGTDRSASETIQKSDRGNGGLDQLLDDMSGLTDEEAAEILEKEMQKPEMKAKSND